MSDVLVNVLQRKAGNYECPRAQFRTPPKLQLFVKIFSFPPVGRRYLVLYIFESKDL